MANFSIVLFSPDIPGNTGSIGRTCVALDLELILIKPYGFDLSEKAVRRAGLDYWKYVNLKEYDSWEDFIADRKPKENDLMLFSRFSNTNFYEGKINKGSYLIFGSETKGLPSEIKDQYKSQTYCLPMYSDHIRSLNLANCATAVAYEGIRQINFN